MKRGLILLVLLGLTACAARPEAAQATATPIPSPTAEPAPLPFPGTILLGRPTDSSIAITLRAEGEMQAQVEYGADPARYDGSSAVVSLRAGQPQTIEITGLSADQAYHYRVRFGAALENASTGYAFHTQRAPGSAFTFAIEADPHNREPSFNGELYAVTLNNVRADRPDFLIDLGDTFMTEKGRPRTYADAEASFLEMLPFFGITGPDVPLYLVNGNHEGELGWLLPRGDQRELPVWSAQIRQLYYPNPLPGGFYSGSATADPYLASPRDGYYAWTWGDALFIALDPFWYTADKPRNDDLDSSWNWTLGREQYDWLRATLENSDAAFTFVFIHHLVGGGPEGRGGIEFADLYEWGGNNSDGSYGFDQRRPGWGAPIHDLLVANGVSAVFHGHDHVFVRQELDGIVYQEMPQPSIRLYENTDLAAKYGYTHGDVVSSSGHLRVTVTPEAATVDYVRAYLPQDETRGRENGQIGFSYTIPARP